MCALPARRRQYRRSTHSGTDDVFVSVSLVFDFSARQNRKLPPSVCTAAYYICGFGECFEGVKVPGVRRPVYCCPHHEFAFVFYLFIFSAAFVMNIVTPVKIIQIFVYHVKQG